MTAPADPQLLLDQAVSRLTGPGGPFEIVEEEVLGTVMPVMKNRGHAIGELISASRAWGDGDYLVTSDRRISFTEHADSVAALATALRDKYGVRKGDRVGILAANTPEWVMTFFATQALGALEALARTCAGEGPAGATSLGQRFRWLTAPRSTVVHAGPVHAGLTEDPVAELDRLVAALVA